jgi:energy-coupling factor transport system permease protein
VTAPAAPARRTQRPVVLLVPVPGTSPIHELWAGTKLLTVFAISAVLTFFPGWVSIVLVGVLVLAAAWLARIPRGALPSVPRLMWLVLALGGLTAALAGGPPVISIGDIDIGFGGVLNFVRLTTLSAVLLGLGAMVSWTTNVAEIGPALATLSRPFRVLRIPVDEWAVATALALRAFPMLIDEFQVLYAARRLRPKQIPQSRKARRQQQVREMIDLLAAAITVTMRRADEMGDAITARGGTGQLAAAPARPKLADWLTLALVFGCGGGAIAVETIFHLTR